MLLFLLVIIINWYFSCSKVEIIPSKLSKAKTEINDFLLINAEFSNDNIMDKIANILQLLSL